MIVTGAAYKWLCALALIACVGCDAAGGASNRPKTYPVSGTVKHNGKPVEGATVTFHPIEGKSSSIGSTDANGKYSLSTFGPTDGAPEGQYKISIAKYDAPVTPPPAASTPPGQFGPPGLPDDYAPPTVGPAGGKSTGPKNLLPPKYANADSSALRATVDKGSNTFDFDLK